MKPIIEVQNISKQYRLGVIGTTSIREVLNRFSKNLRENGPIGILKGNKQNANPNDYIWALKDVSFTVQPGEIVGLIGRNGCGKSTLLKILSRITFPTEGRAVIRGKSSALLEVGTGFHAELSGRENIFLNGAILGMRRREIQAKFDAIVDFSENEAFIDTPVKHYSKGMYTRLAFAVAAHLNADILLLDEVLEMGDIAFQKRAIEKMIQRKNEGKAILFVSHDSERVEALCDRAVTLSQGKLIYEGDMKEGMRRYLTSPGSSSILNA